MVPLAAIPSLVACLSYAYLALFGLTLDKRSRTVRLFILVEALFCIWSAGVVGILLSANHAGRSVFERVAYLGAGTYSVAGLFMFKSMSGFTLGKHGRLLIWAVLIPVFIIQTANLGWNAVARQFPSGPFYIAHQMTANAYSLAGLILIALQASRSGLRRKRLQTIVIVAATLIGIPIGVALDLVLGHFHIPSQGNLVPVFWSALVLLAIARYDLFRDSWGAADQSMLLSCDEPLLVFDPTLNYAVGNTAAGRIIGSGGRYQRSFDSLFEQGDLIKNTLRRLMEGRGSSLETGALLRVGIGGIRVVRLQFLIHRDRWSDPLRLLCFVRPMPQVSKVAMDFALSPREREIMEHVLAGASQQRIASILDISIPTVKTHTGNLYNKLGIESRTELFALFGSEYVRAGDEEAEKRKA